MRVSLMVVVAVEVVVLLAVLAMMYPTIQVLVCSKVKAAVVCCIVYGSIVCTLFSSFLTERFY